MPLFLRQRDLDLFNTMTKDLVDDVIEIPIYLYKLAISSMQKDDLYGDSVERVYYAPVKLFGLISHDDESQDNTEVGLDMNQKIVANFQRDVLRTSNVYPELGDILEWNNAYYEIDNINENQLEAGIHTDQSWSYNIECSAHMARRSKIQIEKFRVGGEI
jgi:hypothetical protein